VLSEQAGKFNVGGDAAPVARTRAPAGPAKARAYVSLVKALPVTAMAETATSDWASF
jgi:methyl-accepting chemotaxis protein